MANFSVSELRLLVIEKAAKKYAKKVANGSIRPPRIDSLNIAERKLFNHLAHEELDNLMTTGIS